MPPLQQAEAETLKEAFNTGGGAGYVLDFSDRTLREYLREEFRLDLEQPKYCVNGMSKGKRVLTFLSLEDGNAAARVLHSLWQRRRKIMAERGEADSPDLHNRYFAIVGRLQGYVHGAVAPRSEPVSVNVSYRPPPREVRSPAETVKPWIPEPPAAPSLSSAKDRLKQSFMSLIPLQPQVRGFAFEKFLGELFEAYGLAPRPSFRLIGEQIDGSITFEKDFYLLEAKWQNGKTGVADLLTFHGKVAGKSTWSRGLFISYAGFSDEGLEAFARGRATNIICMDGYDLHEIITRPLDLRDVIGLKLRRAAETSRAFVGVSELFP